MTAFLGRMTIRTKVAGAFGFVLLIVLGLGLTAINRLKVINDHSAEIRDDWLPSTGVLGQLLAALQEQLGLRLVRQRSEIEMFVIDQLQETPTEN